MKLTGLRGDLSVVRDVQMEIVRKTAPFGPVLLLAPNDESRTDITSNCSGLGICEFLADGKVRVVVVPHDTPWIRDYGPFIELSNSKLRVVDSGYHDVREIFKVERVLKGLLERRLALLKHAVESPIANRLDLLGLAEESRGTNNVESQKSTC